MTNSIKRESLISRARDILRPRRARRLDNGQPEPHYDADGDSWSAHEHGEEYRYGQRQPHQHAKRAYQAAAALAHQAVSHAPFYMEEIGLPPAPAMMSPPPVEESQYVPPPRTYAKPTRFYPEGGQPDRVGAIQAVGRAQLQRILPSYELSTAETRESGLGPALERGSYPPKG